MLMYGSTMFFVQVLDRPTAHPGLWTTTGVEEGTTTLAAGMATSGSLTFTANRPDRSMTSPITCASRRIFPKRHKRR